MKEMVGVIVENNGAVQSFELNAFGAWFIMNVNGRRRIYKSHSYEDCGKFIFRVFKRETIKSYKQFLRKIK